MLKRKSNGASPGVGAAGVPASAKPSASAQARIRGSAVITPPTAPPAWRKASTHWIRRVPSPMNKPII